MPVLQVFRSLVRLARVVSCEMCYDLTHDLTAVTSFLFYRQMHIPRISEILLLQMEKNRSTKI